MRRTRSGMAEAAGMGLLLAWTVAAVAGYGTFGRHPELLAGRPELAGVYAAAFRVFAQGHVWLGGAVLGGVLLARVRWRWVVAFAAVYVLSLAAELAGTTTGVPFGKYEYSEILGPQWLGHVPVLIPVSWFVMALSSYALADRVTHGRAAGRVVIGSLILLAWDLALDPAMSGATRYWRWEQEGPYYGMPWTNLMGWYATGVVLLGALSLLRVDGWLRAVPVRVFVVFYAINLLLPLGMCAAAGMWGAVVATLFVLGCIPLLGDALFGGRVAVVRLARGLPKEAA